jgi:hypothetical protein
VEELVRMKFPTMVFPFGNGLFDPPWTKYHEYTTHPWPDAAFVKADELIMLS